MDRPRHFEDVQRRLRALSPRDWEVEQPGEVWGYPFFQLQRTVARHAPTVLLTAGMHGEEPGGVEGVLRWLESRAWRRHRVNWVVFPCINPYGWERNQRRNRQRRDINRQFRARTDTPEAELIKRLVRGRRFLFSMEFHEDIDASGYYLYELRGAAPFIGERILRTVGRVIHINRDNIIDGRPATGQGLIRRDGSLAALLRRPQWPMAFYLYRRHTEHVLGSETPVNVPLERRAEAHCVALQTALRNA